MQRLLTFLYTFFALIFGSLSVPQVHAQKLVHIFDFGYPGGNHPNGAGPSSTLLQVAPGTFYGTTAFGGAYNCGTLFSITSTGVFSKLYDFPSQGSCSPVGALAMSKDGMLYGVETGSGYALNEPATLFRSDLSGNVSTVASFGQNENFSAVALTPAPDGSLYLALNQYVGCLGGTYCNVAEEIVHYTSTGSLMRVASISASSATALTPASDGNLYGAADTASGILLFQVSGNTLNRIKVIRNSTGANYVVGLSQGTDHRLYFVEDTAIFSTALDGSDYRVVQMVGGQDPNVTCVTPQTGLTLASDGALYGGCSAFSSKSTGTIFRISSSGQYSEPYQQSAPNAGSLIFASASGLATQAPSGILFGEVTGAVNGTGPGSAGFIYALDLGLPKAQK